MDNLWIFIESALIGLGLAFSGVQQAEPVPDAALIQEQETVIIHPFTEDNIKAIDGGYLIRDNGTGAAYIFDGDTLLIPEAEGDIPGYIKGEAPLEWFERYLSQPMESGLGYAMGDLFDAVVTGEHIDALWGVSWWD